MNNYIDLPLEGGGGGGGGVTSLNGLTGALSLVGSAQITVTPSGSTLIIATTGLVASINGDSTAAQTLTTGTTGTDFAIVNNGLGDHKFNLPTASAVNRGALSSADWTAFNSKQSTITIGALDAQAANANGLAFVSNVLSSQSATAAFPGMVNTTAQTFAGAKTFTGQVLASNGTVSAPGLSFSGQTNSGLYTTSTAELSLSVAGQQALDFLEIGAGQVNIGLGESAMTGSANFFDANRSQNGATYYVFSNQSNSAGSSTNFIIQNGTSSNYLLFENFSQTGGGGYLSGYADVSANNNMLGLNLMSEYSSGAIRFNVGGRDLAHEAMRLSTTNLTINKGWNFVLSGATSGTLTFNAAAATTSYAITYPAAQGGANTSLSNNGAGVLTWADKSTQAQTTKTANYTILSTDSTIFADTSGGAFTLTLPSPTALAGKVYRIIDSTGFFNTNNLTLAPNGAEKIEGLAASKVLQTAWGWFNVTTNGTDWFVG